MKTIVQGKNASPALRLANAFLSQKEASPDHFLTPRDLREGVEHFSWIGRFQHITQGDHRWLLDRDHNELSVPYAAQWFAEIATKDLRL